MPECVKNYTKTIQVEEIVKSSLLVCVGVDFNVTCSGDVRVFWRIVLTTCQKYRFKILNYQ